MMRAWNCMPRAVVEHIDRWIGVMMLLETRKSKGLWHIAKDGVLVGVYPSRTEAEHAAAKIATAACKAGFRVRALDFKDDVSPPREKFLNPQH
jgi:hypothetical protein